MEYFILYQDYPLGLIIEVAKLHKYKVEYITPTYIGRSGVVFIKDANIFTFLYVGVNKWPMHRLVYKYPG